MVGTVSSDANAGAPAVPVDVPSGAPAGSLEYFGVLFSAAPRRVDLRTLYAIDAEIRRSAALANHDIAHMRLQWWRQELDRSLAGHAQHPLAVALQSLRSRAAPTDLTLLRELTVAADLDLASFQYATWSQLAAYCFRSSGALQTVIAATLVSPAPLSDRERSFARQLGAMVRQVQMLRDVTRDTSRGRCYAPIEALEAHGLTVATWFSGADLRARAALLADWQSRVAAELQATGADLTTAERVHQRHGLVLRALYLKLLDAIRARSDDNAVIELSGRAKLWTAWRAAVNTASRA
jgi:phytoene synthase